MEILRKNQTEMIEIKNGIAKMKNSFDGVLGRIIHKHKQ